MKKLIVTLQKSIDGGGAEYAGKRLYQEIHRTLKTLALW
jgi:hypothetical protein